MPFTHIQVRVDGGTLFGMVAGSGDPLVLVHGGWTDHGSWQLVAPELAESFHVVAYDRRGPSRSRRAATGPGRCTKTTWRRSSRRSTSGRRTWPAAPTVPRSH